ncbi:PspC domain-containing protein [Cellulomonas composti]|nr:PspC domain-containing protein [Cellulomonas composti]
MDENPTPMGAPETGPAADTGAPPAGTFDAPTGPPPVGPAPGAGFFDGVRRLGVSRADDRWIGGVCAGAADRFGIDPLVVRAVLGVTILLGGFGLVAYGVAWGLLPERRDGRIHVQELFAGRFDPAVVGAAAFVLFGFGRGSGSPFGWGWGPSGLGVPHVLSAVAGMMWFLLIAGMIVGVVVLLTRRPPAGTPPQADHPVAGPGTYPAAAPMRPAATAPVTAYPPTAAARPPYGTPQHPGAGTYAGPLPYAAAARPPYGTAPYPTSPYAPGPAPTATRTAPAPTTATPPPMTPPTPRRRAGGPGVAAVGIVVALGLIALAALLAADRTGAFDGPVLLTTIGIFVVLAGLGIVVAGLRGRSSGVLGFLAIVALLVSVPVGVAARPGWLWEAGHDGHLVSSSTVAPTTRADAEQGLQVGMGDAALDLSAVPMTDDPLYVPVSVGAGNVHVVVPADAAVEASIRVGAGTVTWDVDGSPEQISGLGLGRRTFQDDATRADGAQLVLDVQVGAGEVTITREDS